MATEVEACTPVPVNPKGFNPNAVIPYGVTWEHVRNAMVEFTDFLGFVNTQLNVKELERLESFLMPANFSSMVGEFMGAAIPKHCDTVARNRYHNGHPDVVPMDMYPDNSILHAPVSVQTQMNSPGHPGLFVSLREVVQNVISPQLPPKTNRLNRLESATLQRPLSHDGTVEVEHLPEPNKDVWQPLVQRQPLHSADLVQYEHVVRLEAVSTPNGWRDFLATLKQRLPQRLLVLTVEDQRGFVEPASWNSRISTVAASGESAGSASSSTKRTVAVIGVSRSSHLSSRYVRSGANPASTKKLTNTKRSSI